MSDNSSFERITKSKPCAICGKDDWCTRFRNGGNAVCMRVESDRPCGNGGWLHKIGSPRGIAAERTATTIAKKIEFEWLTRNYEKSATNARVVSLAKSLGVAFEALRRLQVGWDGEAFCFPMRDATGKAVGIRRRLPDGKKLSVRGGHEGLFTPIDLNGENPLVVCEGASDTAALLSIGVMAVGRPSCSGGVGFLRTLCEHRRIIIIADNDAPGIRGANELKARLDDATVVIPPDGSKDIRDFLAAGGTRIDIDQMIHNAV
jgi:5S rRNA maturation endonuclease (ribonuclease M5)